jgi:hypothetical protein
MTRRTAQAVAQRTEAPSPTQRAAAVGLAAVMLAAMASAI